MIKMIKKYDIPFVSLAENAKNDNIPIRNLFYKTDGHWKSESGFWANSIICEELKRKYNFDYNSSYTDAENYDFKVIKNKLSGVYRSKSNVEDLFFNVKKENFAIITPKFDTKFTVKNICSGESRTGKFEDSVLFEENNKRFVINYSYYSNGDIRLQLMQNELNTNGKTIYLIRTSFACVVSPFLALQTSKLYNADLRVADFVDGDQIFSAKDFVKENKPDYVIILYNGVYPNEYSWDFDQK